MVAYFLKSGVCLALLLFFYHLVLEREKMHHFNRFYLLGSMFFSFLAPLFIIYTEAPIEIIETVQVTANDALVFETTEAVRTPINYWNYFIYLSIFVSSILLIRFTRNIFSIYKKTKKNTTLKHKKATLVLIDDAISPHTFWNYIFINKNEYYSQKIEEELFTHELTHATQKHTFDVLLVEVLKIIFWFNPIFYFLKKTIQLNHEFLADTKVISNHKNISEYQYLLLNKTAWNNEYYLASNLNYLLTKKRLLMMTKQSSRTKILIKKLAVIPVIAGFIFLFAERVEAETMTNDYLDSEIITKQTTKANAISSHPFIFDDIKKILKEVNSLKSSIVQQDTILKKLPNGNLLKIWEDKVSDYLELYKTYETLRNQKPHYIKSSTERKKRLNGLLSKLGSLYFKLSKTDKRKVKRPMNPVNPYVQLKKNNKVFYKLKSELTREDKKLLPPPPPRPNASKEEILKAKKAYAAWKIRTGNNLPPPPPKANHPKVKKGGTSNIPSPPKQKTGFYEKNDIKLYYVKNEKGIKYYNRYGQLVTKKGKVINPEQTKSTNVISGQNITKIYKNDKVVAEFKRTNLPPSPPKVNHPKVKKGETSNIPTPPLSMSAKELVSKHPNATYYINNKKVSYKKVLTLVKNQKGLSILTQFNKNQKVVQFKTKDYAKKGWIKIKTAKI